MFLLFGSDFFWSNPESEEASTKNESSQTESERKRAWKTVNTGVLPGSEIHLHSLDDLVQALFYALFDTRVVEILDGIESKDTDQVIDYLVEHQSRWRASEHLRLIVYKAIADQPGIKDNVLGDLYEDDDSLKDNPEQLRGFLLEIE